MTEEPLRCYRCGHPLADHVEVCPSCGTAVMRVRSTPGISWQPPGEAAPAGAAHGSTTVGTLEAPAIVARRVVYAGFWLRALAFVDDTTLLGAASTAVVFALVPQRLLEQFTNLAPNQLFDPAQPTVREVMTVAFPVYLIAGWLYYALFESSAWQATPGKRWLGLIVTDRDGRRIGFGRASARYFGKLLSGQLFALGYIIAGFTARKQALHDFIAGCLVLRRPPR
jgi:uncharacterized RDD family membrane protein YckC